jgi:hypothetical protein
MPASIWLAMDVKSTFTTVDEADSKADSKAVLLLHAVPRGAVLCS